MGINANISTENIKRNSQRRFNLAYILKGYGACIPVIDGVKHPELMFGYTSENDAKAALNLIKMALEETNGDIARAKSYITNAMQNAAKVDDDDEDEEVIIVVEI